MVFKYITAVQNHREVGGTTGGFPHIVLPDLLSVDVGRSRKSEQLNLIAEKYTKIILC